MVSKIDIPMGGMNPARLYLAKIRDGISIDLPEIDPDFVDKCALAKTAKDMVNAAQKKVDTLSKEKPVDEEALKLAKLELEDATNLFQKELGDCQEAARGTLAKIQHFLSPSYDDKDLLLWIILHSGNPKRLAQWIAESNERTDPMERLLNDPELQRQFLEAGGAVKGNYGRCMEIYEALENQSNDNPLMRRMVTAIALSHADGICEFKTQNVLDPTSRYLHYEQAYLLGELDPNFSSFSTWELRHVVDNDATDDVIGWGRQSLMNYRPDICIGEEEGSVWQYCRIVRTDVGYRNPDWWSQPVTYEQILSGGGKCGPRAWYGRFICKSFGIPTWGCRQPGHAAMARWTKDGWMTCLGAGFPYSWWENTKGNDFYLETQARAAVPSDRTYMEQVLRLEWFALFKKENYALVADGVPDPSAPYFSLSMLNRKLLCENNQKRKREIDREVVSKLSLIRAADVLKEEIRLTGESQYIIPAVECSSPEKPTKDVLFLKSFLGGQQLYIQGTAVITYTLGAFLIPQKPTPYKLSCLVSTVHRGEKPLKVVVSSGKSSQVEYDLEMPYTKGMWTETEPILIDLGGAGLENTTLSLNRQSNDFGIALKHLVLERQ